MKKPRKPRFNKAKAFEDTKRFFGLPPYNIAGNLVYNDPLFAQQIQTTYGKSPKDLYDYYNMEARIKSARIAQMNLLHKFEFENEDWKDIL